MKCAHTQKCTFGEKMGKSIANTTKHIRTDRQPDTEQHTKERKKKHVHKTNDINEMK